MEAAAAQYHGKSPRYPPKGKKTMKKGKGKGKGKTKGKGKGKPAWPGQGAYNGFLLRNNSNANGPHHQWNYPNNNNNNNNYNYGNPYDNNENNDVNHDVNYDSYYGYPPPELQRILIAIHDNDNDALHAAITENMGLLDEPDRRGYTPLQNAVESNNKDALLILLTEGADINHSNPLGDTALHVATRLKKEDMVNELLELHANTEIANNAGKRPIDVAAFHGHAKLIPKFPRIAMPGNLRLKIAYHAADYDQLMPTDGTFAEIYNDSEGFLDQVSKVFDNPDLCAGISQEFQQRSFKDGNFLVTAETPEGYVLGASSIIFVKANDYFEIDLFCSDYNYKGIGTFMMNAMKKLKTSMNKKIKLESVINAHNFYIKQGFSNNVLPEPRINGLIPMTYS